MMIVLVSLEIVAAKVVLHRQEFYRAAVYEHLLFVPDDLYAVHDPSARKNESLAKYIIRKNAEIYGQQAAIAADKVNIINKGVFILITLYFHVSLHFFMVKM